MPILYNALVESITLNNLESVAKRLLEDIEPRDRATIIALQGELGAGKTTFVQAIARVLGIEERIQSPTYVLMKSYPVFYKTFSRLIHIDAYRLDVPGEFLALKPEAFLHDPHALVCIEWPENVGSLIAPHLTIKFSSQGAKEGERYIEIT